jgi:hypothetical protein
MNPALFSALLLLFSGSPQPAPDDGMKTVAEMSELSAGIKSYTFDLHVNILVHTFPELRFHLDGTGEYRRPSRYTIRFKHVPWFGKGFENVSLGPLDPSTWPKQYEIVVADRTGDVTTLSMHDRVKSPLTEARAKVDARTGLRQLVWTYSYGGRIQLDVSPRDVAGFPLPETEDADIVMPRLKVSAHADFKNYSLIADEADVAP